MTITVIGSGVAGWTLVRELRKLAPEENIRLITADSGDFYSKPMLSNALASGKTAQTLVMTPGLKMAEQQRTELIANCTVSGLNTSEHTLQTSAGEFVYSKLVLCVGAETIELPISGSGAKDTISVNDLGDYALFRDRLSDKKRVALIGAGLIGCEFANDLRKGGVDVVVYDLADRPLPRLLPEQASTYLKDKLSAAGVQWKLGRTITSIDRAADGYLVTDSAGQQEKVELVLSAVGLKPRTKLAEMAGAKVATGIHVNELGETSLPDIYALGDCAQYFGQYVMPYIMPVMQGARAMAKTLSGEATPIRFPAMPVTVKTPDCPTVVCPPLDDTQGSWDVECTEDAVKALFKAPDGSLLGLALLGEATKERQTLATQLPSIN